MSRVIHFEIQADDPERAANFYKSVFGWEIQKWEGPEDYWLVTTGPEEEPGINGAIMTRSNPGANVWNTVGAESLDDVTAKIESNGGKVVQPRQAVPGVGYHAYFEDSEGNIFGVMQEDPSAQIEA